MFRILAVCLFVVCLLVSDQAVRSDDATPQKASPTAQDIARWMSQLGDNAFQVRETASRHLREAGFSARPALRIGLKHQDAEVRIRCQRILTAI